MGLAEGRCYVMDNPSGAVGVCCDCLLYQSMCRFWIEYIESALTIMSMVFRLHVQKRAYLDCLKPVAERYQQREEDNIRRSKSIRDSLYERHHYNRQHKLQKLQALLCIKNIQFRDQVLKTVDLTAGGQELLYIYYPVCREDITLTVTQSLLPLVVHPTYIVKGRSKMPPQS